MSGCFPRWCTALFTLLPMSELLYLPADGRACTPLHSRVRSVHWPVSSSKAVRPCSAFGSCTMGARLDLAVSAACIHRPHEHFPAEDRVHPGRSCGSTVVLLTVCILLMASMGLNRCAMWALPIAWLAGHGTPALRRTDIHTAYACQLFRTDSGIAAAIPAYSVLPAAGIGRTGVFSAGDQAVPSVSRGLSAGGALLALLLLRTVLLLGANTAALLPYPAFTAAGLAAIGNFCPTRRGISSQCSPPVRLADAPHLSACCCIRSHAPAAFCTCADRNRIWATPHN